MKNKIWIFIVVIAVVLIVLFIRFVIGGNEDTWIKDGRGVYVKHGNPAETPDYVLEQQELIDNALDLYQEKSQEIEFSSQCLGNLEEYGYVVDIVHDPRNNEDNLPENQCEDYKNGKFIHFIELDGQGNVVRIV